LLRVLSLLVGLVRLLLRVELLHVLRLLHDLMISGASENGCAHQDPQGSTVRAG